MNTVNNLLSIVAVTQKPILVSAKKNDLSFLSVADVRFHTFFLSLPGAAEIGQVLPVLYNYLLWRLSDQA